MISKLTLRSKKRFIIFFSLLSLILLGALLVKKNYQTTESAEIITIMPETGLRKKRPEHPGGLVIAHSDSLIYEQLNSKKINRKISFAPSPEKPLKLTRPLAKPVLDALDPIDHILNNIELYEDTYLQLSDLSEQDEDYIKPNSLLEEKLLVKDLSKKIKNSDPAHIAPKLIQSANQELNEKNYKIQLFSTYSYLDAQEKWQNLLQFHPKLLANKQLLIRQVQTKNDHIFFLVLAGDYHYKSEAKMICRKLIQARQNCIVVK